MVFQHLGCLEKLLASHWKAFGRIMDLQVGLLTPALDGQVAVSERWGRQVSPFGPPKAMGPTTNQPAPAGRSGLSLCKGLSIRLGLLYLSIYLSVYRSIYLSIY